MVLKLNVVKGFAYSKPSSFILYILYLLIPFVFLMYFFVVPGVNEFAAMGGLTSVSFIFVENKFFLARPYLWKSVAVTNTRSKGGLFENPFQSCVLKSFSFLLLNSQGTAVSISQVVLSKIFFALSTSFFSATCNIMYLIWLWD